MSEEIYILKAEKDKLLQMINKATLQTFRSNVHLKELEAEINKARVIDHVAFDKPFIRMNSKVVMTIDREEEEITLVYPEEADVKSNKISVLSPIGTAILGYCVGSCVEWKVPSGTINIQIQNIIDK